MWECTNNNSLQKICMHTLCPSLLNAIDIVTNYEFKTLLVTTFSKCVKLVNRFYYTINGQSTYKAASIKSLTTYLTKLVDSMNFVMCVMAKLIWQTKTIKDQNSAKLVST